MGTWLKRNTSKKYVLCHEHESMDRILEGLLESEQPDGVKAAIIGRICEQGGQPSHPASTLRGVFQVSCKWILQGTSTLQVSSGFKLLQQWGSPHLEAFLDFFTPSLVAQVLAPGYGNDANVPLLIREGLRVLTQSGGSHLYQQHALVVRAAVTRFVGGAKERVVVRNVTALLGEFTECAPTADGEVTALCQAMLQHLSVGVPPADGKEILRFIKLTDEIAAYLSQVWKLHPPTLLGDCLAQVFRVISVPRGQDGASSEPAICLAAVVPHVPIEMANRVVKEVVTDPNVTDEAIGAAVGQIIEWLKWPTTKNVDLWLNCFLTELAAAHKYSLLVNITEVNTEQVVENLPYPQQRSASFGVLTHLLLSFQHSPSPFHKALQKFPSLIHKLRQESNPDRDIWLGKLAQLIHCLMHLYTGFPELYGPVLELIKDLPSPSMEEIKSRLKQMRWTSQISSCASMETITTATLMNSTQQEKLESGKTGLENLGNTCYMNSVLQALYMCDQFRRGIVDKAPSGGENLLAKLQYVFAMLSQSSRPAIAPRNFLLASRPPWFLPGHQQDCSEFLKYLLDQLHENEKSVSGNSRTLKKTLSSTSIGSSGSKRASGKGSKKGEVLLMGMKLKTDEVACGDSSGSDGDASPAHALSLVEKTFRGKVQTTLRCLACRQESKRVESFSDIPLAFPNSYSKSSELPQKILVGGSGPASTSAPEGPEKASPSSDQEPSKNSEDCFTLSELLSFYLKPEKLTGDNRYHCDTCGKLQDGERSIDIVESPQYLILTLLRFSYDTKLQTRTKIFHDVHYPRTLAVPVCKVLSSCNEDCSTAAGAEQRQLEENGVRESGSSSRNYSTKMEEIAKQLLSKYETSSSRSTHRDLYGLSGVVVHSGTSSECGHYYCYSRHSQAGQVDTSALDKVNGNLHSLDLLEDKWYNFNDNRVSHASFHSFSNVTKQFSKDTPYVLIYRKLNVNGQGVACGSDLPLRADLRDAVIKDNEKYLQEQELEARVKDAQRRRSASVTSASLQNWRDDNDDDDSGGLGGPPGCGGGLGGDLDTTGSRFVF